MVLHGLSVAAGPIREGIKACAAAYRQYADQAMPWVPDPLHPGVTDFYHWLNDGWQVVKLKHTKADCAA